MPNTSASTFLLTWDMGEDFGHLARLRPVAQALRARGHRVVMALRHLGRSHALPEELLLVPAPGLARAAEPIREPATFADILFNLGVTEVGELAGAVRAWRGLLELVRPDVVVQDFSPISHLALQGWPAHSVFLGTGFACPPDTPALPDIRAWQNHYPDRLRMTEQAVLASLNECLLAQGQPAIAGVGELFGRVSRNYLATFPELDHYPQRKSDSGQYLGVWSDLAGSPVHWPDVPGPRLFAYLKSGPYLTPVLDGLRESGLPCIVFGPALPDVRRWQGENIRFFEQPLDMTEVCAQCDRAIVHAGHGSTASLLLAGKPILQLPMNVEQYHTALNTERLGAGRMAPIDDPAGLRQALAEFLVDDALRQGAETFAERHRDFDPEVSMQALLTDLEQLCTEQTMR